MAYARESAVNVAIDPGIFERQINWESGFQNLPANAAGATGVAQIVPYWHPAVDATDPMASLRYAAGLMRNYLDEYGGDWTLALVRYNGGTGGVIAWLQGRPYEESQNYVRGILG